MTASVRGLVPDLTTSVFRYLLEIQYERRSDAVPTAKGLRDYFQKLRIVDGYPDDLVRVAQPTLAVGAVTDLGRREVFYGPVDAVHRHTIPIFGFAVRQGTEHANKTYSDQLRSDVYELLADDAGDVGMPLYDRESKAVIGAVDVINVRARAIPNAPEPTIEVERNRFVIELDIDFA